MATYDFPTDPKIDALIERFPRIFKGAQPYAWSDLPQGWTELAERLFADVDRMLDDEAAKAFEVRQIKEKFGGLRVYWRFAEQETTAIDVFDTGSLGHLVLQPVEPTALFTRIRLRVQEAADEAARTCQHCGNGSATANNSGLVATLCGPCRTQQDLRQRKDEQT